MAVILMTTVLLILTAAATGNLTNGGDDDTAPPYFLRPLYSTSVVQGIKSLVIRTDWWIQDDIRLIVVTLRRKVVAPVMRVAVAVCMAMSVMLLAEVVVMAAVSIWVLVSRRKPEKVYKWEKIGSNPENLENSFDFPMVLVQIPMFNEKKVYKLSIGAACELAWPRNRLMIQVLDDSTDLDVK